MLCEVDFKDLHFNPYNLFWKQWAAVMAGNEDNGANAMTIAWGLLGSLWDFKSNAIAAVYVRESRYTKQFMDREPYFTINVLPAELRKAHGVLGGKSGRDMDKFAAAGLTPVYENGYCYIAEAEAVYVCRKLYAQEIKEELFTDPTVVERNYANHDMHTQYMGEIVKVLMRSEKGADGK